MNIVFDEHILKAMNALPEREKYKLKHTIKSYLDFNKPEVHLAEKVLYNVRKLIVNEDGSCLLEFDEKRFFPNDKYGDYTGAFAIKNDDFLPFFTKYDIVFWSETESEPGDIALVKTKKDGKYYMVTHDPSYFETLDCSRVFHPEDVEIMGRVEKIYFDENTPEM